MPEFVVGNEDGSVPVEPEGDYILEVTGYRPFRSKNQNECIEIELVTPKGIVITETLTVIPSCFGRITVFCNALGCKLVKGQHINIDTDFLQGLLGRRGWATLSIEKQDPYPAKNKVAAWIINKPIAPAQAAPPAVSGTAFSAANPFDIPNVNVPL
jgi:hypothetical protein